MNLSRHVRNKQALIIVLNGTPSFDPSVSDGGIAPMRWDLGDGTLIRDATTFTHNYADTNVYTVVSYKRLMKQYVSLQIFSDDLVSVDMHSLTGLGGGVSGAILLHANPNLTSIIWPINQNSSIGILLQTRFENCNLIGAVEISGLTRMGGVLWGFNNDNMTSFTLSAVQTASSLTSIQFQGCNSLATLDLSGAVTMRGTINSGLCNSLTSIVLPNNIGISTGVFVSMQFPNCTALTTLDLSTVENAGGGLSVRQNVNMTTMLLPPIGALSQLGPQVRLEQSGLTGTVDFSDFTANGQLRFQQCPNLTEFIPPVVTGGNNISIFWGNQCDLTGVLDLTNIEELRSSFTVSNNPNLTGINFYNVPHSNAITLFTALSCNLTGNLDLSMFQGMGHPSTTTARFDVNDNPNLTGIDFTTVLSGNRISFFYAHDCDLTGTLNISKLTLRNGIRLYNNPNLTGLTIEATNSELFNQILLYNCNFNQLNFTGWTEGARQFQCHNNPNLTSVKFDAAMQMVNSDGTSYRFDDCNLTGVLDISGFDKLGGLFWTRNNSNLVSIIFPTSTVLLDDVRLENCNLTGTLDWSTCNVGIDVQGGNNPLLTQIINPTNSNSFALYSFSNCGLTYFDMTPLSGLFDSSGCTTSFNANNFSVGDVNRMLAEFDANSSGAIGGRTLNLAGAGMGIPDASAGGNDGIAAKASLIVKGYSCITN